MLTEEESQQSVEREEWRLLPKESHGLRTGWEKWLLPTQVKTRSLPSALQFPAPQCWKATTYNSPLSLTPFLPLSPDPAQELEAASLGIVSHPQAAQSRGT